jgi:hypothetical protein
MKKIIKNIIKPENNVEVAITSDADFINGCKYGKPRSGHPEGKVIYHISEVLKNVDKYSNEDDRSDLRFIAIIHDSFKNKVNRKKPKIGDNHHAMIARTFAEKYTTDSKILFIIEAHDEAYNAWQMGGRRGNWYGAEKRARKLIDNLIKHDCLELYIKFFKCDNETGNKTQENYDWFINVNKKY